MSSNRITQKITPFLWFEDQAEEAARFYTSVFQKSKITNKTLYTKEGFEFHGKPEGSVMTVNFELEGQEFTALNGGPYFQFTPAISFAVNCQTKEEVDALWQRLSPGGTILMDLDKYEWSDRYGWIQDRFGLSWQLGLGGSEESGQKIIPSFLFAGDRMGMAELAIQNYTNIFDKAAIDMILKYGPDEQQPEGNVKFAQFDLEGMKFSAMESHLEHNFTFNEAISFVIHCKTQEEVDHYWYKLSEGGDPAAQNCGWLKDKFGISWQVVPHILTELLNDADSGKVSRVTQSLLKMKKIDISVLLRAYGQKVDAHM